MFAKLPLSSFFFPWGVESQAWCSSQRAGQAGQAGLPAAAAGKLKVEGRLSEDSDKSDSTHSFRAWVAHRDPLTPTIGGLPWAGVETVLGEGRLQRKPSREPTIVT